MCYFLIQAIYVILKKKTAKSVTKGCDLEILYVKGYK